MSLRPRPDLSVPDDTARVARAIFPEGNLVMQMRDRLLDGGEALFRDDDFADLFPQVGQPAAAPARLALVLVLQFMEALTDRQAADAVRTRIDWKYLLGLPLTDGGFHHTVLSEFRTRLLDHGAERRLFEAVLEAALARDLVQARGRQRTDSTHVLAAVHSMTRIEAVTETLRHALNDAASLAPEWLLAHTAPEWVDRYGPRASDYRLPKSEAKRRAYVEQVGTDGAALLDAIRGAGAPEELRELAAIEILRRVWIQNFKVDGERVRWRESGDIPPTALFVGSPYDLDARYAKKRTTRWTGYKVHLTETCDDERPNLITAVATTSASASDDSVTSSIHTSLEARDLLPAIHIADTGFVNAPLLVEAGERYDIDLIGPTRGDNQWQLKEGAGFAARDFDFDWDREQATCPEQKISSSWTPAVDRRKNEVVKIKFAASDCGVCPSRARCTRSSPPRRTVTVRHRAEHEALQSGRARERTAEFAAEYARRAGVEGTIAQGTRSHGLRRSRYVGLAKTHLQHLMTATAMNVVRLLRWLGGEVKAVTRPSAFARLYLLSNAA